jgi:hypothetical protein
MPDLPPDPDPNSYISDSGDNAHSGPPRDSAPATPRWVYMFGLITLIIALVIIVLHVTGGGFGGHMP